MLLSYFHCRTCESCGISNSELIPVMLACKFKLVPVFTHSTLRPGTSRNSKEVSAHLTGKQLSYGSIFNALQSASHCICHIRFQRFACSDVLRIYVFRYVVNLFSFGKILLSFISNVSILVLLTVLILKISNSWRILAFVSNASDRGSGWLHGVMSRHALSLCEMGSADQLHVCAG